MIVEVKHKTRNTHPHTQSNQQTCDDDRRCANKKYMICITIKFAKGKGKLRLWAQNGFTPNHDKK